ncbi:MAG: hypothetical protein ACRD5Z_25570, partial [Bryobacteraceae bacterium]
GELSDCAGDHTAAFARYEERMMPFLKSKQESAAKFASTVAPKSSLGVTFRNHVSQLLRIPVIARLLIGRAIRDNLKLPEYRSLNMLAASEPTPPGT